MFRKHSKATKTSQSGTLFCGKAHGHILFILQNIERRDLIAIYFGPP